MSGFACFCSIFCKYSANFCWLFWGNFLFPPVWFSVISVSVMETDNNEIKQAIQTDIETGDGILSRAAEIARGGPCTGADVASGTQQRGARVVAHDQRRQQDTRLIEWARASNRLIDNDAFQYAVDAQGDDDPSGGEQDVYYDPEQGRWLKRNTLILHQLDGWHIGFLHRLLLHNWLFPEVAYQLEGYALTPSGLQPVISQPDVWAQCGANRTEATAFMQTLGFRWQGANNFIKGGLFVGDLHDENILITPAGNYAVIDPEIHLTDPAEDDEM